MELGGLLLQIHVSVSFGKVHCHHVSKMFGYFSGVRTGVGEICYFINQDAGESYI